jgi:hypothetical protein
MRRLLPALVLAFMGGCSSPPTKVEVPFVQAANEAVTVGKSTKADVRAALGEATVVDFESGYEVWVYREKKATAPPGELVLLFAPSGVVTKARIR